MTYEDFIYELYKNFGMQWYSLTPTQNARMKKLYDLDASEMLTASLWVCCGSFELYQIEPWVAAWFDRKRAREIQEQEVISGYEF